MKKKIKVLRFSQNFVRNSSTLSIYYYGSNCKKIVFDNDNRDDNQFSILFKNHYSI
jgi:hypothetical protein